MTKSMTIGDVISELKSMNQTQKVVNAIRQYESYPQDQEVFNAEATQNYLKSLN